ncbi:DEAD/DEAH box helicase [Hyphobacterium marinum]|uniref:DEAD/DEAH box helicase n=1 Tax=Hyphobacterium marinum TaxID=3116574 RepID=A0ABU7M2D1_9PROT|nr:DEAD/DEAH box helicase [Hyphobacterium sp. Y6023]MEE2567692.1 DEAD/DEAH box helicase [Hyphobacterium sp. Y6023]
MTTDTRIAPALARALAAKGYDTLTEVQEAVIAPEARGRDLLVSAQTGSGKTVAFGMAIAPTLLGDKERFEHAAAPLALIVAPTRELALQVQRELTWLYAETGARLASCVGGMDPRAERRALERGCHIAVGTPGRLRDHIERGALDLSELKAVVLDEADEMLDFGFREDLEFILDGAPGSQRTLLFSATVPKAIADIARRYQNDALRLSTAGERSQHADIDYRALTVAPSDRENAIINVLRYYEAERAIVFCATREGVNRMASRFGNRGFSVVALSGELSQKERTHALQSLRDGRARICIATDVAARGIDLPGLELVIHADLPVNGDTLKHRSGRTGRAGQRGVCVLIVPANQRGKAQRLLRFAHVEAEWGEAPGPDEIKARDRERLLSLPALSATYGSADLAEARGLIGRYGAEQVAAAFLAHLAAEAPPAEELANVDAPRDRKPTPRDAFNGGTWFRLTAGRNQRAEPRWLLPLICRLGDVTRREVGSIRIEDEETRFEIDSAAAGRFLSAVKANGGGEGSIRVSADGDTSPIAPSEPASPARAHGKGDGKGDGAKGGRFKPGMGGKPPKRRERPFKTERRQGDARKAKPRKPEAGADGVKFRRKPRRPRQDG